MQRFFLTFSNNTCFVRCMLYHHISEVGRHEHQSDGEFFKSHTSKGDIHKIDKSNAMKPNVNLIKCRKINNIIVCLQWPLSPSKQTTSNYLLKINKHHFASQRENQSDSSDLNWNFMFCLFFPTLASLCNLQSYWSFHWRPVLFAIVFRFQ